jgi:hypothetical protein
MPVSGLFLEPLQNYRDEISFVHRPYEIPHLSVRVDKAPVGKSVVGLIMLSLQTSRELGKTYAGINHGDSGEILVGYGVAVYDANPGLYSRRELYVVRGPRQSDDDPDWTAKIPYVPRSPADARKISPAGMLQIHSK